MQCSINRFGKLSADAWRLGDLLKTGSGQLLQPAEVHQQLAPALRADSRDAFQRRGGSCLAASCTVTGDGKAVCFVTHLLNQMQGGRISRQRKFVLRIVQVERFEPWLACDALGDAQ